MTDYYSFTEERPWGGFLVLLDTPTHKVKQIVVWPGHRLSYQYHAKRTEHWVIIQGEGFVILNDKEQVVVPGDTIKVDFETKHRIGNRGKEDLIFIEVQRGTYFGEDDIVLLEDDYKR